MTDTEHNMKRDCFKVIAKQTQVTMSYERKFADKQALYFSDEKSITVEIC